MSWCGKLGDSKILSTGIMIKRKAEKKIKLAVLRSAMLSKFNPASLFNCLRTMQAMVLQEIKAVHMDS